MEFNLVQLALTVYSPDISQLALKLPHSGRVFAACCRDLVCHFPGRECNCCSLHEQCQWHLIFSQTLTSDPAELKRHQKPPLPFIFSFPSPEFEPIKSSELQCGLVVVGRAISYLPLIIRGLSELLQNENAEIVTIGSRDYQGNIQPLGDSRGITYPENMVILSSSGILNSSVWNETTVNVRLRSPLYLSCHGRLLDHFEFSIFACSVMRRVSSLAYYYSAYEFSCDYKILSEQTHAVRCLSNNFFCSYKSGGKKTGIMGSGCFHGDFSSLLPFLVLGMYVHVGKGASFGMGRYDLI